MIEQKLKAILQQPSNCKGFECSDMIALQIETALSQLHLKLGIVKAEDAFYETMRVHTYITLFAQLARTTERIGDAIHEMQLREILRKPIKALDVNARQRVRIAREIIMNHPVIYLHEPLKNVDESTMKIILQWIEKSAQQGKMLYVTSTSFKDICMMPEKIYSVNKQGQIQDVSDMSDQDVEEPQPFRLSVRVNDKTILFQPHEIDYVESLQGKNYLHVQGEQFSCSRTMNELEISLRSYGFYRCHRSYLVNMQKVQEIIKWTRNSYTLKLEGNEDTRVPLSKGRMEEMKELYNH